MCDSDTHSLSSTDVARALGVSESSVKRWIDGGSLSAARTPGGHRRVSAADLFAFAADRGLPIVDPEALGLEPDDVKDRAEAQQRFARALRTGDGFAMEAALRSATRLGDNLAMACDGVILPSYQALRDECRHPSEECLVLHRAISLTIKALERVAVSTPKPPARRPRVLFADVGYPIDALAVFLGEASIRDLGTSLQLGSDVPDVVIRGAIAKFAPDLLWLSASGPITGLAARKKAWASLVRHARRAGCRVVAYGDAAAKMLTGSEIQVSTVSELRGVASSLVQS